ncbi:hypothetical protein [Campylobacter armoricus]|nr:hypothetical protein [Campylobacter armoricus]
MAACKELSERMVSKESFKILEFLKDLKELLLKECRLKQKLPFPPPHRV